MRALACGIGGIFVIVGCTSSPYALVSHKTPQLIGPAGTGKLAIAEQSLTRMLHEQRTQPLVALGDCLIALKAASDELKGKPTNATAARDYNFALSRLFQIVQHAKIDIWTQPLTVPSAAGDFILTYRRDPRPEWNPARYDFTPADEFD